jgi:hypothetical protein
MKMMKSVSVVCIAALAAGAMLMSSCSSAGSAKSNDKTIADVNAGLKNANTTQIAKQSLINWDYRELGQDITKMPDWLKIYMRKGVTGIEKMDDYTGKYAFVAINRGPDLQFLQTWSNSYSIQTAVAGQIRTAVSNELEATQNALATTSSNGNDSKKSTTTAGTAQKIANRLGTSIDAMFSGLTPEDDYWTQMRIYDLDDKTKYTDQYTYYVLYLVDKTKLDDQIANALENNKAADAAEAALGQAAASQITKNGLTLNENAFLGKDASGKEVDASALKDTNQATVDALTAAGDKTGAAAQ